MSGAMRHFLCGRCALGAAIPASCDVSPSGQSRTVPLLRPSMQPTATSPTRRNPRRTQPMYLLRSVSNALLPLLAVTIVAFTAGALEAQAVGQLAGTVTDAETSQPVSFVQISVLGTTIGGSSGPDGRYTIA